MCIDRYIFKEMLGDMVEQGFGSQVAIEDGSLEHLNVTLADYDNTN